MNRLEDFADTFDGIQPFRGVVPDGYLVDFLGTLTDVRFRAMWGGSIDYGASRYVETEIPTLIPNGNGEGWLEFVNWFVAAREARGRFVMITLGACYGAQAVGSVRALQLVNPMPYKLVAVEAEPENCAWTARHMRDNGIDPDQQWIIQAAMSDRNAPVLFPVGSPGSGAANCVATNHPSVREAYAAELIATGRTEAALRDLLLNNSTGLTKNLIPGYDCPAEIKLVSAVTLKDVLGPFDVVDYLESDIQQSEIFVFPPFMEVLKRKVRRVHIGTHGKDAHDALHGMFKRDGWDLVFSFEPNAEYDSALGRFTTNDGLLTARNPDL